MISRGLFGATLAFALAACAPSNVAVTKRSAEKAVDLPYRFSLDGFDVEVSSPQFMSTVSGWNGSISDRLAEDERWLAVNVAVTEMQGRERAFPWVPMVRLRTALGLIVNAPHALRSSTSAAASDEKIDIRPNQRDELRLFFRVKQGDFPVHLVLGDGAAVPLGE